MDKHNRFFARTFYNIFEMDTLYIGSFNAAENLFATFKDGVGIPLTEYHERPRTS
jgi:hypothetical protein